MKKITFIILSILCLFNPLTADEEAIYIDITFLSAYIAPTKVNGKGWDAGNIIPKGTTNLIAMATAGSGYIASKVMEEASKISTKGMVAPDVDS